MSTANPALPGGPNSPLATEAKTKYELGLIVDQDNLLNDAESDRNAVANIAAGILGTYNCQVADYPIAIVVSGLALAVGGIGQKVFVQGRIADYIPTTNFTAAAADPTASRTDGLFIQYTLLPANGRTQTIIDGGGTETDANVPDNYESVTWSYVEGTVNEGVPATPPGFELFAEIVVAAGATTAVANIQFPTVTSQLLQGNIVKSLNGLFNVVNITSGEDIVVTTEGQDIVISLGGGLVASVNELGGVVTIKGGDGVIVETADGFITLNSGDTFTGTMGIVITETDDPPSRAFAFTGTVINGFFGAVTLVPGVGATVTNGDNEITVAPNLTAGPNITLTPVGAAIRISAAAPDMPITAFAPTSGRSATAEVTLPNNGVTYNIFIDWTVITHEDLPQIVSPGSGVTNFVTVEGDNGATGATSAAHYARAACNAVGTGATIAFTLTSGGGSSTNAGFWAIQAFPTS